MNPSGVVGRAAHKTVEHFLKGGMKDLDSAIDVGQEYIDQFSDAGIDYGKTGSREKMNTNFTKAITNYFEECPDWENREILFIEERFTEVIHDHMGNKMPLPAVCVVDVVWRSKKEEVFGGKAYPKGSIFIEDHKFVSSYTNDDDGIIDPTKVRQAFFNFLTIRENLKEEPVAILYRETKLSKNSNGDAQCQYYPIDFKYIESELPAFINIMNDCTRYLMQPEVIFLPNPSDMFDGKDSWQTYRDGLIDVDSPKVIKKTRADVEIVERTYQESASSMIENRDLIPEERIRKKLQEFAIPSKMTETYKNGSVVMYTLKPSRGVKMSTIEKHSKDIAIALESKSIRIQAPIMGTDRVGIEVPNEDRQDIPFFIEGAPSEKLGLEDGTLNIPIGVDVYGKTIIKDLADMPHLLIAGSTGSGKSVMLNTILHSLLTQNTPEQLNLVLIDPKRVELTSFADYPHVLSRIIHKHEEAIKALSWLIKEMDERYEKLQKAKKKGIKEYNEDYTDKIPRLVVVIDEFASLILTKERGEASLAEIMIVRLAQEGRAAGIHLVIATQRPSVDVVTGLIKANLPTRICFMTTSKIDSKIVLDQGGAEELVGKGDMLFMNPSIKGLKRLQGFLC